MIEPRFNLDPYLHGYTQLSPDPWLTAWGPGSSAGSQERGPKDSERWQSMETQVSQGELNHSPVGNEALSGLHKWHSKSKYGAALFDPFSNPEK